MRNLVTTALGISIFTAKHWRGGASAATSCCIFVEGSFLTEMLINLMFQPVFQQFWIWMIFCRRPSGPYVTIFYDKDQGSFFLLCYMLTPMSASVSSLHLLVIIYKIQSRKEHVRSYIVTDSLSHVCRTGKCNKWPNLFIYFGLLDS